MPEAVTGQHALCGVRLRRAHRQHDSAHLVCKPTSGYSFAPLPPGLEREGPWAVEGHCNDPTCIMMFLCLRSCCDRAMCACMGCLQQLLPQSEPASAFLAGWAACWAGQQARGLQQSALRWVQCVLILDTTLIPNLLLWPRRLLDQGTTLWDLLHEARGPLPPTLLRGIARELLLVRLGPFL